MPEQLVTTNGVQLCVETFGDRGDPPVLLIAGAAMSRDGWDADFCGLLADNGRFVIRYDHRDTGRSTTSPVGEPSYTEEDLATDPLRILDGLEIARAHIVGLSMGGGMAQQLAALHPDRLLTLTLVATSPAGRRRNQETLPPMEPRLAATFEDPAPEPAWDDREAVVDYLVEAERPYAGTLGFDEERARRRANRVIDRTHDIAASMANHWILASDSSNEFRLADIALPTLVMHGTADPLFPFAHGEALAAEIPGASLVSLDGMGHEMPPPQLWDTVVRAIVRHTQ